MNRGRRIVSLPPMTTPRGSAIVPEGQAVRRRHERRPRRSARGGQMPTVRRVIHAVLFAAAITTGSSPAVVLACSCSEYPTFEQAFLQSAAVFRGTVTSIVPADPAYF